MSQGSSGPGDVWHMTAVSHMSEHSSLTEDARLPPSCQLETASGTRGLPAVYKGGLADLDQTRAGYASHKTA